MKMPLSVFIIILIGLFLYTSGLHISIKPFSIKLTEIQRGIAWIFLLIGFVLMEEAAQRKGMLAMKKRVEKVIDETNQNLKDSKDLLDSNQKLNVILKTKNKQKDEQFGQN